MTIFQEALASFLFGEAPAPKQKLPQYNQLIVAIAKAGNPDTQPGVDIIIGPGTEIISCEGLIVTAGGVDSHIHFIAPQQIDEALASGVTTMLGGGIGRVVQSKNDRFQVGDIVRRVMLPDTDPEYLDASQARVALDGVKWEAGKRKPKVYGDKLDLNHSGKIDTARELSDDELARIAAAGGG